MRAWPDLTEYHEAVQHPPKAFADPGLKAVTLELDRFGMPKPATGGNAVVYKAHEPGGLLTFKKNWAIRCFLRPINDHAERYEAIYQHPERSGQDYGQEIDRFSALVIYLSLAALERDVTLWERFHTGDNLIFVREDFLQVGRSAIWQQLRRIGSREIDQLAAALAAMVQQHPMKVGNLDSVLKNPASYPASSKVPTSIPASTPAQRVAPKPARVSTPPVPSWMKKSGYRDHSDD